MPELAEVEYYCKQWRPGLQRKVSCVRLNDQKRVFRGVDCSALRSDLAGEIFTAAETHGKQMCFRFGFDKWLGVHLGMTGKTRLAKSSDPSDQHEHLRLHLEGSGVLVYSDPRMFGRVRYERTSSTPAWWSELPPEILSEAFTLERMSHFLDQKGRTAIKSVLLIQSMFPGVGNWMADEILWRSQIRPHTVSGSLGRGERERLYLKLLEVCLDAKRVIGSNWGQPPDSWLFNHRWKDGHVCPETGAPLVREKIGGRTSCWSPQWQS